MNKEYLIARLQEAAEEGWEKALATYEDDKAEGFIDPNFDVKEETIKMLRTIDRNSHSTTVDGEAAVVIDNCSMNSFLWTMNQAISLIKDNKVDQRDN